VAPLLLEYAGGVPAYDADPLKKGLTWAPEGMDREFTPAGWGLTLVRQSLALLSLGRSNRDLDQFLARVMAWQMDQKVALLYAANDLVPEDYGHLAHRVRLRGQGSGGVPLFEILDSDSHLADQAALLWGLSRMRTVFRELGLTPPAALEPLLAAIWQTLETRHWDEPAGTYATRFIPGGGSPDGESSGAAGQVERRVSALEAMLSALALHAVSTENADLEWGGPAARRLDRHLAFLENHLVAPDGGVYNTYNLDREEPETGTRTLLAQSSVLRALLLKPGAAATARNIYGFMAEKLWDGEYAIFRDAEHWGHTAGYTAFSVGATIGALRELALKDAATARSLTGHLTAFMNKILGQAQLQLDANRRVPFEEPALILGGAGGPAGHEPVLTPVRLVADKAADINQHHLAPVLIRKLELNLIPPQGTDLQNLQDSLDTDWPAQDLSFPLTTFRLPETHGAQPDPQRFDTTTGIWTSRQMVAAARAMETWASRDNPYLSDPGRVALTAADLTEYARANLWHLVFNSRLGVPLAQAGNLGGADREPGPDEDQALGQWLAATAAELNLDPAPVVANPIYLEFAGGVPHFREELDQGWEWRTVDNWIATRGLAQSLLQQAGLLEDDRDSASADRQYLARVLGLMVRAKLHFIDELFAASSRQGLGLLPQRFQLAVDSAEYPLGIELPEQPGGLLSQLELLQALGRVASLSPAAAELIPDYASLQPMLRGHMETLWQQIRDHYPDLAADPSPLREMAALDVALVLDALSDLHGYLPQQSPLADDLKAVVAAVRSFVVEDLVKRSGLVRLDESPETGEGTLGLATQGAVLMGLLGSMPAAGLEVPDAVTEKVFRYLDNKLWNAQLGLYLGEVQYRDQDGLHTTYYPYRDLDFGASLAALTRMLPWLDDADRSRLLLRLAGASRRVLENSGTEQFVGIAQNQQPAAFGVLPQIIQGVEITSQTRRQSYPGDLITFRIIFENGCFDQFTRTGPMTDVILRDLLPPVMTYLPGSTRINGTRGPEPFGAGSRLTWHIPELPEFTSLEMTFQVFINEHAEPGVYENIVEVGGRALSDDGTDFQRCTARSEEVPVEVAPLGRMEGRIFMDANADGVVDANEAGIADIRVLLDRERMTVSNPGGVFTFDGLLPGTYRLDPDWTSVDPGLMLSGPIATGVEIRGGETARPALGWITTKTITGWVFDDRNGNGRRNGDEPMVPAVRVKLADTEHFAYTARDGHFKIKGVPLTSTALPVVDSRQPYLRENVKGALVIKLQE